MKLKSNWPFNLFIPALFILTGTIMVTKWYSEPDFSNLAGLIVFTIGVAWFSIIIELHELHESLSAFDK
jgi:hypothetical protein